MFNARYWARLREAARRDRQLGASEAERLERYNDDLRGELAAHSYREFSIRDLFEAFVDNGAEIAQSWSGRRRGTRDGVRLVEAGVDTSQFANISGQIVFNRMLEVYNDPVFIGDQLMTTIPTEFNGEKIPGIGRLGDQAESIGEGEAYPMAGVGEEWIETPETVKRGFIVPITKEAIFFDRTGLVMQRATEVAQSIRINKEKRQLDAALGITTLYKRNGSSAIATYGDNSGSHDWDNLAASNALADWTDIENALLLFDDITDPNTGEPVIVNPNTLVVPSALAFTAARIQSATEYRHVANSNTTISGNPLSGSRNGMANGAQLQLLSNQYVKARTSSASTWFIGDFRAAFAYMENWPLTNVAAPVNSEAEFQYDIVHREKVSERGTVAVLDPRKVVKCTA